MKLASFDLEIAKAVEGDDWQTQRLGISCAAVMLPEMNVSGAAGLVRNLAGLLEGPDMDLRYFYEISMNQSSVMQPQMSVSGAAVGRRRTRSSAGLPEGRCAGDAANGRTRRRAWQPGLVLQQWSVVAGSVG